MLKVLLSLTLASSSLGWMVEVEPHDHVPMYSQQNISLRLLLEPGDEPGDQPLQLQLRLVEDDSWSVTLLTNNISFDYKDVR